MNERLDLNFYKFLAAESVICNSNAADANEIISLLAERLSRQNPDLDKDEIISAVLEREELVPTVLAPGLAVPHARVENINSLMIAMATSRNGIDFKSEFGPAKVVILILTPRDDPGLFLQVLSGLAKDFMEPQTIDSLLKPSTPEALLAKVSGAEIKIAEYLVAGDVISDEVITMPESATLREAIETFAFNQVGEIPIVDEENDLRGVISTADILRFSLPEHILWLDDLSPIYRFQPFSEMLKSDEETKIADFMREELITADADVPAIQLAKLFLQHKVEQIIITKNNKFFGVVKQRDFIIKLFWE